MGTSRTSAQLLPRARTVSFGAQPEWFGHRTIFPRLANVPTRSLSASSAQQSGDGAVSPIPARSSKAPGPRPEPRSVAAVQALTRVSRIMERAAGGLSLAHFLVLAAVEAGDERASRVHRGWLLAAHGECLCRGIVRVAFSSAPPCKRPTSGRSS